MNLNMFHFKLSYTIPNLWTSWLIVYPTIALMSQYQGNHIGMHQFPKITN